MPLTKAGCHAIFSVILSRKHHLPSVFCFFIVILPQTEHLVGDYYHGMYIREPLSWSEREAAAREIMTEAGYDEENQEKALEEMRVVDRKL